MNEPQLDQKIQQDITRVKKDMNTLMENGINTVSFVIITANFWLHANQF